MTLLVIDWSVVGIKAGQLVLCLSILVVLHELGHFLPAKWFKCRVEKFYLFFDPWFSLFKKKIGDTVYGIGWLPFGGYVKISGMIDESMDKEQLKEPAQPWEFRSKPAWQRLIIMIGGVTVNLILGFFIFAMILWVWGEDYLQTKNVKYGVYADSLGRSIGIKDGDMILGVNGKELDNFSALSSEIILNEAKNIQLIRDGQRMDIPVPDGTIRSIIKRKGEPIVVPKYPAIVDTVERKVAKFLQGELRKGDQIISIDGVPVGSQAELMDLKKNKKNTEVSVSVLRGADTISVKAKTDENARLGFISAGADRYLEFTTKKYTFGQSLPAGVKKGWGTLVMNIKNFKLLFTSKEVKASESLGSFISIGGMFGASWDWQRFWSMTALLSIILAFMNILPIPALDGGHVVFTIYEMITGHKPSDKFMEYAQMVGMVILLGLMAYALGLDIFRLFK
ncbi:MAG: RIP metalloprotease RseP [Sphingobacteriales bacterium]|nr:RIP metalloprotease RseP [Sphingobacteriales bacterium]